MDVKYQIFISSTFNDLEEERRKVTEQILNLGHIPVGMELFQAGDETQWEYIKRRILECDYYLVIVAERYGSVGTGGRSYTQMEYEFAIKNSLPSIAFLLHKDARKSWPQDKIEFSAKENLNKFRSKCEKKLVKHWRNADDLCAKISSSLMEIIKNKPQIGWVRSDQAVSSLVTDEIARLSDEKRILQEKLRDYEGRFRFEGAEVVRCFEELTTMPLIEYMTTKNTPEELIDKMSKFSLADVLKILSHGLAIGRSSQSMYEDLIRYTYNSIGKESDLMMPYSNLSEVLAEFSLQNLVMKSVEQNYINETPYTSHIFSLTEFGKLVATYARRQNKDNLPDNAT